MPMMSSDEIWDGPGDGYYPGDDGDDDCEGYDHCTVCGRPVYGNGSSPETTVLMHSDPPADGHAPQL